MVGWHFTQKMKQLAQKPDPPAPFECQSKILGRIRQVRLGQVRLGQVRLGQVRLGQVRLGQVRLDQARLGQVRLDQVRLVLRNESTIKNNPYFPNCCISLSQSNGKQIVQSRENREYFSEFAQRHATSQHCSNERHTVRTDQVDTGS